MYTMPQRSTRPSPIFLWSQVSLKLVTADCPTFCLSKISGFFLSQTNHASVEGAATHQNAMKRNFYCYALREHDVSTVFT